MLHKQCCELFVGLTLILSREHEEPQQRRRKSEQCGRIHVALSWSQYTRTLSMGATLGFMPIVQRRSTNASTYFKVGQPGSDTVLLLQCRQHKDGASAQPPPVSLGCSGENPGRKHGKIL